MAAATTTTTTPSPEGVGGRFEGDEGGVKGVATRAEIVGDEGGVKGVMTRAGLVGDEESVKEGCEEGRVGGR